MEPTATARFDTVFLAHYGDVLAYAARRTGTQDAEDITAEVFETARNRLGELHDPVLPWLLVVARNALANRHRAGQRAHTKIAAAQILAIRTGRDPADAVDERDIVLQAFATLREADQEVLRLLAWDGLSITDAARVAGTGTVALRMRASRARRRLAAALDALDADSPHPLLPRTMELT